MTGARWLATARAAHTRAMGAPQRFPLLGDGAETHATLDRLTAISDASGELTGAALAEARYRDWYAARATGALDAVTGRVATYPPPALSLTSEAETAAQARLTVPPPRARADAAARLAMAERIIRGLVDEFGDLFPDETAAAVAWLKADG